MSRYYCQLVRLSSNVSPSIKMLSDYAPDGLRDCKLEILDAGCGNGRNSIALAKRFHANVLLVDYDSEMMEHARHRFLQAGLPLPGTIEKSIEEILEEENFRSRRFEIVILSYVLQHINPVCFTRLFDTLKQITTKFLAIDTYWNPSYCQIGERKEMGSTSWYGISREELIRLVAPRFRILGRRTFVSKPRSVVTFSVLCVPGIGSCTDEEVSQLDYESLVRAASLHRRVVRPRKILVQRRFEEISSFKMLQPHFQDKASEILKEMNLFIAALPRSNLEIAAKYLRLSREHGFPVSLNEISADFEVDQKRVLYEANEEGPLGRLSPYHYVQKIVRFLGFDEDLRIKAEEAIEHLAREGNNPAVIAAAAAKRACEESNYEISTYQIAKIVHVSTVSIKNRGKQQQADSLIQKS